MRKVLVCEDDGSIRQLLGKVLIRHGLSVDSVATALDAAMHLRRESYDLIVLDLLTPEMTGYELINMLLAERPHLLERVIVITALQRAFRDPLPVAAVVRKPFDLDEFDGLIERVLLASHQARTVQAPRVDGGLL